MSDQLKLFADELEENQGKQCENKNPCECDEEQGTEKEGKKDNNKKDDIPDDFPRCVCYAGHQRTIYEPLTMEEIRKRLQKEFPELRKNKTDMQYEVKKKQKIVMVYPVVKAAKAGQLDRLNNDDIQFLKELANELKTQDRLATAKPVFWQIEQKECIVGLDPDYSDDHCIVIDDDFNIITDFKEAVDYLKEFHNLDYYDFEGVNTLKDIEELCKPKGIFCEYTGFIIKETYQNAFLTRQAIENHINENSHHYKNPVKYCCHGWRNPQLKRLLEIIEKFAD